MFLDSNGMTSSAQVSAPMATTPLLTRYFAPSTPEAGFTRVVTLVVVADQPHPAGVEYDDVALTNFDALFLGGAVDFRDVKGGAFLDQVGAEIPGHVEQHAAGYDWRDFFDAEFFQPVRRGEIARFKSVVVGPVDADVAKAVDLAADSDPAFDDVIVVGRLVRTKLVAAGLSGLKHEHLGGAGRKGRGFGIGLDPKAICLASLDQSGGLHNNIRGQIVGRADLIVRAPFRFRPVLSTCRSDRAQQDDRTAKHQCFEHRSSSHLLTSWFLLVSALS